MDQNNRDLAASAADHWTHLAETEEAEAARLERLGKPYGSTSAYDHRARSYRDTAHALRLEAETGKPHCSICFQDHPNHLHRARVEKTPVVRGL